MAGLMALPWRQAATRITGYDENECPFPLE